jgi:hypothetical protein
MRSILLRTGGVAVLIGVAALGLAWANPQESRRLVTHRWVQQFGMVTPANGQTLRLHVVHLGIQYPPDPGTPADSAPPEPIFPPDPCRVVLAFFDSQGRMIGDPNILPLDVGKSTFKDLTFEVRAESGFPPDPCRAAVWVLLDVHRGETPPDPCKATLELLDTASGRASLHMLTAAQHKLTSIQR